jgi:hypothetical protein
MDATWLALLGLGAFHGINPGMGWLFAVALGMQERRRGAVMSALLPLGIGHALAVAAAVLIALLAGLIIPLSWLRWFVAGTLVALGIARLLWHRHPRWASMRVTFPMLTLWSFLMASAHGAGLMVVPFFLGMQIPGGEHMHYVMTGTAGTSGNAILAVALHASSYLLVTAVVALVVFEKVGVGILRKAWFNLDLVWAAALIGTAAVSVAI